MTGEWEKRSRRKFQRGGVSQFVMAGHKREARLRQVDPAIHDFLARGAKTWMPGTSPGMTKERAAKGETQSFKNSPALYSERNGRPACANASVAPSSRSTMVNTSATLPPTSRTASTAFIAEPPVVVTSSTITMRLPCRLLPFVSPSPARGAPCSFGLWLMKNATLSIRLITGDYAVRAAP